MDVYKERALYGKTGVQLIACRFDGPADGESALKESRDIEVQDCFFNLRYPFWYAQNVTVRDSIKNPKSGTIKVMGVKEIIRDDVDAKGRIVLAEESHCA